MSLEPLSVNEKRCFIIVFVKLEKKVLMFLLNISHPMLSSMVTAHLSLEANVTILNNLDPDSMFNHEV